MFLQPLAVLRPVTATPLPKQKADTQRSHYASRKRLWLWLGDHAPPRQEFLREVGKEWEETFPQRNTCGQ